MKNLLACVCKVLHNRTLMRKPHTSVAAKCCESVSPMTKKTKPCLNRGGEVVADLKGLFTFWESILSPGEPAGQQSPRPPDQREQDSEIKLLTVSFMQK